LAYSTFDVPFPESVTTLAAGINNMGEIVGSYYTTTSIKGFLRDGRTFTTISPPTTQRAPFAEAFGLNDLGQIVGIYGACDTCTVRGFLLSGGAFHDVIDPAQGSGGVTFATGINNRGTIVGFYGPSTGGTHGFVLGTDDKYATLDFPGATDTLLWDINNAGQIVGRYIATSGVSHGFLFSDHGFTSVDFPGATFTQPMGINDRGDIVGIYSVGATPNHGFLLISHGGEADDEMSDGFFTPLDFPGGSFTSPNGISNGGEIVGYYSDPVGRYHGFVAVVEHGHAVSEPPSVALLLIGGIVLLSFPKLVLGCALARWPHRVRRVVVSRLVAERVAGRMDADHEADSER
jgi:uncharacterized membrane protein